MKQIKRLKTSQMTWERIFQDPKVQKGLETFANKIGSHIGDVAWSGSVKLIESIWKSIFKTSLKKENAQVISAVTWIAVGIIIKQRYFPKNA